LLGVGVILIAGSVKPTADYPIKPVPYTEVRFLDGFWAPRLETVRTVTLPHILDMNERTGRVDNFRKAAGRMRGAYSGRRFNDTDVYKALEGAAYVLARHPDTALRTRVDSLIAVIVAAQEEDGYLYAARTVDPENPAPGAGPERWVHLQGSHELYNAGHLYEAAAACYRAMGECDLMNAALRNADLVRGVFGSRKRHDVPGHQEIEIGLVRLFRITGNGNYLNLARFFLDERGRPHDSRPYPDSSVFAIYNERRYRQDHRPVEEQERAVGHAVRATYMYAAMADVSALTGRNTYLRALERIWTDLVSGKLYLTGGIGSRHTSESFGEPFELPNRSAYTETCASIGLVLWNHRMFLANGYARYIDILERTLYNGLLSGISVSGDRFFYQNPLESAGGVERSEYFECACCPGNLVRFLPAFGQYVYACTRNALYVNLYATSQARVRFQEIPVTLIQQTGYPWEGRIELTIRPTVPVDFTVYLRIPGWLSASPVPGNLYQYDPPLPLTPVLKKNGNPVPMNKVWGFTKIPGPWRPGDRLTLELPMTVRRVRAHPRVEDDRGKVAYERGPLVFCAEQADNPGGVLNLRVDPQHPVTTHYEKDLLGGVMTLKTEAVRNSEPVSMTLIPYYAWANRGAGQMAVWFPEITK
jgi:DUF1680 family protein